MDDSRFDNLARSVASPSRRTILRHLAGVALGTMLIPALEDAAAHDLTAKCKKFTGGKKKHCLKKAKKHNATHTTQTPPPDPCVGAQCGDQGPTSCATNGTCAHGSSCGVDTECQSNVCIGGICCSGACAATNATATCEPGTGRCFLTCNAGWGNCDGDGSPESGCETRIDTEQNCGDCGFDCSVGCEPDEVGICQVDTCICQ